MRSLLSMGRTLIRRYGRSAVFERAIRHSYDAAEGEVLETTGEKSVRVLLGRTRRSEGPDPAGSAEIGEVKAILSAADHVPQIGDRVTTDGVRYRVCGVDVHPGSGIVEVQLRPE
jgi:hypothetical protein